MNRLERQKLEEMVAGVHLSHCNQGDSIGSCEFGVKDICPAFKPQPSPDEEIAEAQRLMGGI